MRPRVPSISWRSVTSSRSFSSDSRSSSVLPSTTTSTSNSLDGKRRVTASYCLNSGVSERNNWLSESSTLMRPMPNAAAMHSTTRTSVATSGKRSETRPMRSMPSARRCGLFFWGLGCWGGGGRPLVPCGSKAQPHPSVGSAPGARVSFLALPCLSLCRFCVLLCGAGRRARGPVGLPRRLRGDGASPPKKKKKATGGSIAPRHIKAAQ